MEELEKVELVREKCDVSYEEAREVLKANDYDVLDAIVQLERESKAQAEAKAAAEPEPEPAAAEPEVIEAEAEIIESEVIGEESANEGKSEQRSEFNSQAQPNARPSKASKLWNSFRSSVKRVLRGGLDLTFVAERNGEEVFTVPVLFVVIGLLMWGAAIWLMVIGLFFGFRYRIEGASPVTINVNEAMDKAADLAEDIKRDIA